MEDVLTKRENNYIKSISTPGLVFLNKVFGDDHDHHDDDDDHDGT